MQRWWYGTNNVWKTCHVYLEEGPWWAFFLEWVSDSCIPRWRIPFLERFHTVQERERYTVAEWYGDTLDDLWHAFVTRPLFDFSHKHIKVTGVPLSWEECRKLFYEKDKARWDEDEADPEFGKFTRPDELDERDRRHYDRMMLADKKAQEG